MKNKTAKKIIPTEHQECVAFVQYLEIMINAGYNIFYTKTAQETYTKSFNQKRKNKNEGVKPGLPDYILIINYKLIFIEMKRIDKNLSKISKYQSTWIENLKNAGIIAVVCFGFEEAKKVIDRQLGLIDRNEGKSIWNKY